MRGASHVARVAHSRALARRAPDPRPARAAPGPGPGRSGDARPRGHRGRGAGRGGAAGRRRAGQRRGVHHVHRGHRDPDGSGPADQPGPRSARRGSGAPPLLAGPAGGVRGERGAGAPHARPGLPARAAGHRARRGGGGAPVRLVAPARHRGAARVLRPAWLRPGRGRRPGAALGHGTGERAQPPRRSLAGLRRGAAPGVDRPAALGSGDGRGRLGAGHQPRPDQRGPLSSPG
jgi:hypothetical protein